MNFISIGPDKKMKVKCWIRQLEVKIRVILKLLALCSFFEPKHWQSLNFTQS